MAPSHDTDNNNRPSSSTESDADLAQAYRDLARGEQAATALEADLTKLESKLDAFLAALGGDLAETPPSKPAKVGKDKANGDVDANADNKQLDKIATEDASGKGEGA
ncbi:hypothetical protein B0T10DRAFT_601286 [Thelonectria olida]|uniref:Uncharacterized protein n=1 Tax=Thelonectria olida TaxID=1576542 RepID=A0A9P8WGA3_9HYPO|nr:hypothetical protein B0T10DRAFT_601286 [Thelonectria olida]